MKQHRFLRSVFVGVVLLVVASCAGTAEVTETPFEADAAVATYDAYIDELLLYTRANFIDAEATIEDAVRLIKLRDPALIDGATADIARTFYDCSIERGEQSRAAAEMTGVDLGVEHVSQNAVENNVWALEIRQIISFEGFPDTVIDATILVTADGVGPTIITSGQTVCPFPDSAESLRLISAAEGVLDLSTSQLDD